MYSHSSTCKHPVRPAPFVENVLPLPLYVFGFFAKIQASICVWVYFVVFNQIPLIYLFFLHHAVFITIALQYILKTGILTSRNSFIVQDCFRYPGYLIFHMKLRIALSRGVKYCVEILMCIALNLYVTFGKMAIFTMLILHFFIF